jgi:peptidoglycan endopeptidase LytF
MNRKHTILIAVMVNAGLLVILFITALSTPEEVFIPSSPQMVEVPPLPVKLPEPETLKPLFTEALDQTLRLPVQPEAKPAAPVEVPVLHPLPSRALDPVSAPPSITEAPRPAPVAPSSDFIEVVVKKGDSLDRIAKEYHTSVSELIKINRLPSSFLRIGQLLKVPSQRQSPSAPKTSAPTAKNEEVLEYYTVKVGDNPWTIAMKHNMKVEELLRLNGLNEEKARKLKPGDRLRTKRVAGR